jgi:hypothetical protein
MCTIPPVTKANLTIKATAAGVQCPECQAASLLDYMRFLDPHGVERVDAEVFECAAGRHTYAALPDGVRLLASDGQRPSERKAYAFSPAGLVKVTPEAPVRS